MAASEEAEAGGAAQVRLGSRLLVAALGGPLVLGLVVLGGVPFALVAALVSGYGSYELLAMLRRAGYGPAGPVMIALSAALPLLAHLRSLELQLVLVGITVAVSLVVALARSSDTTASDWALTLAGALAIGGLLQFLVLLRQRPDGVWWTLAVILGTWACDTTAFATGRLLGRTPLAPRVSPRKTLEGALGSLVGTPAALALFAAAAPLLDLRAPLDLLRAALFGLALAVAATLGDLAESLIKRQCGVKDSGALLPGHGGLLDRIDSILFAGVVGYALALVVR